MMVFRPAFGAALLLCSSLLLQTVSCWDNINIGIASNDGSFVEEQCTPDIETIYDDVIQSCLSEATNGEHSERLERNKRTETRLLAAEEQNDTKDLQAIKENEKQPQNLRKLQQCHTFGGCGIVGCAGECYTCCIALIGKNCWYCYNNRSYCGALQGCRRRLRATEEFESEMRRLVNVKKESSVSSFCTRKMKEKTAELNARGNYCMGTANKIEVFATYIE